MHFTSKNLSKYLILYHILFKWIIAQRIEMLFTKKYLIIDYEIKY